MSDLMNSDWLAYNLPDLIIIAIKITFKYPENDYDDVKKVFRDNPRHDWASHGADNLRYIALSNEQEQVSKFRTVTRSVF